MNGDEEKSALEMALTRLYRYSASEQPPAALDARVLTAARRRSQLQRWLSVRTAVAASLVVVAVSSALLTGHMLGVGAEQRPRASVLGPWQPLQAQFDSPNWPLSRDRKLLTIARYEIPGFEDSLLDAGLADDTDGRIDLRDFSTRARDELGGRP